MQKVVVPVTLVLKLDDTYITLCVRFIVEEGQPYIIIQLEPLYH